MNGPIYDVCSHTITLLGKSGAVRWQAVDFPDWH
jgi:hypothetical protein